MDKINKFNSLFGCISIVDARSRNLVWSGSTLALPRRSCVSVAGKKLIRKSLEEKFLSVFWDQSAKCQCHERTSLYKMQINVEMFHVSNNCYYDFTEEFPQYDVSQGNNAAMEDLLTSAAAGGGGDLFNSEEALGWLTGMTATERSVEENWTPVDTSAAAAMFFGTDFGNVPVSVERGPPLHQTSITSECSSSVGKWHFAKKIKIWF